MIDAYYYENIYDCSKYLIIMFNLNTSAIKYMYIQKPFVLELLKYINIQSSIKYSIIIRDNTKEISLEEVAH